MMYYVTANNHIMCVRNYTVKKHNILEMSFQIEYSFYCRTDSALFDIYAAHELLLYSRAAYVDV